MSIGVCSKRFQCGRSDKNAIKRWQNKIEKERSETRREAPRVEAHRRDMEKIARALGMKEWYW